MPRSSEWAISFRFPQHNRACMSLLPLHIILPLSPLSPLAVSTLTIFKVSFRHPAIICAIVIERLVFVISLWPSFNVSDQVPHPYRTTGDIIAQSILIFMFLNSKGVNKNSVPKCSQHSQKLTFRNLASHI